MSDIVFVEVNFREPQRSGNAKALFRCQDDLLRRIDRAATILCMSRENFVRTALDAVADKVIEEDAKDRPPQEAKQAKPSTEKAAPVKFDPNKPPGM